MFRSLRAIWRPLDRSPPFWPLDAVFTSRRSFGRSALSWPLNALLANQCPLTTQRPPGCRKSPDHTASSLPITVLLTTRHLSGCPMTSWPGEALLGSRRPFGCSTKSVRLGERTWTVVGSLDWNPNSGVPSIRTLRVCPGPQGRRWPLRTM